MRRYRRLQPRARALRAFRNNRFRRARPILPSGAKKALAGRAANGHGSETERIIEAALGADIWTAGFPCQDLSVAGKRAGITGRRSGLWSEIRRAIGLARPRIVILENVANLISGDRGAWFGTVLGDLAALGYDAEWHCISAASLGAPHLRERVWIVAYTQCKQRVGSIFQENYGEKRARPNKTVRVFDGFGFEMVQEMRSVPGRWVDQPNPNGMVNGVSQWPYRLKAIGNAIVPQAAEMLGLALKRWLDTPG